MHRLIWSQLRHRLGRTGALLLAVLVATTGFTLLTGAAATSRLAVTGTLNRTAVPYHILVRPAGTRTDLEQSDGLVRPNSLSGQYGGITMRQLSEVSAVPGVEVAAPIAMLGYTATRVTAIADVTAAVDRSLDRQVIRIDRTFAAEHGLSQVIGNPGYVYVTKNPLVAPDFSTGGPNPGSLNEPLIHYADGSELPYVQQCGWNSDLLSFGPVEVLPDGQHVPVCDTAAQAPKGVHARRTDAQLGNLTAVQLLPDGRFQPPRGRQPAPASDRLWYTAPWTLPLQVAGVDPRAEARLVGLDRAVTAGRYLSASDSLAETGDFASVPALATSATSVDDELRLNISRVSAEGVPGTRAETLTPLLASRTAPHLTTTTVHLDEMYRRSLQTTLSTPDEAAAQQFAAGAQGLFHAGSPTYQRQPDGSFQPNIAQSRDNPYAYGVLVPWQANDLGFRPVKGTGRDAPGAALSLVGMFDPGRLTSDGGAGRVPMETYQPPMASGADDGTRQSLGDQRLLPSGNPGGYLASPPLILVSLSTVPKLMEAAQLPNSEAPLTAIRVKSAGVYGYSKIGAERVRLLAEQIASRTGLDVDIVYGSSLAPQVVDLAPGTFGRPALRLAELWSRKGVAAVIVHAIDRKSVLLFWLVLVVCTLFLCNAVSAAVRDRRRELAVLACLGWPTHRIAALILAEIVTVGVAAGLCAVALAVPLGRLLGIQVSLAHALLAIPVALGVVVLGGLLPAIRAARTHPAVALRPPGVRGPRRRRAPRGVLGMALVNLARVPWRSLLGVVSLMIGISGLTVVVALGRVFHGAVVGTLLGDAVALRVRGVDGAAVAATAVLGAAVVADVLYINIRERARELATLSATGWSGWALGRLVLGEGLAIGLLGSGLGAAAGLAAVSWMTGTHSGQLVAVVAAVGVGGVALAGAATLIPATLLRRLPMSALLADE